MLIFQKLVFSESPTTIENVNFFTLNFQEKFFRNRTTNEKTRKNTGEHKCPQAKNER